MILLPSNGPNHAKTVGGVAIPSPNYLLFGVMLLVLFSLVLALYKKRGLLSRPFPQKFRDEDVRTL